SYAFNVRPGLRIHRIEVGEGGIAPGMGYPLECNKCLAGDLILDAVDVRYNRVVQVHELIIAAHVSPSDKLCSNRHHLGSALLHEAASANAFEERYRQGGTALEF